MDRLSNWLAHHGPLTAVLLILAAIATYVALYTIHAADSLRGTAHTQCVRVQGLRNLVNQEDAIDYQRLSTTNPRLARRMMYAPPTDCVLAIRLDGHYVRPPSIPFYRLSPNRVVALSLGEAP